MRRGASAGARPVLHVCTTCRRREDAAPRDGAKLLEAVRVVLAAAEDPSAIRLNGIECMSGCNRACTVALSSPGKATYLFGNLEPSPDHAVQVIEAALRYRRSETGILPPAERPPALRTCLLERMPARHG